VSVGRKSDVIMEEETFNCIQWLQYYKGEIERIKDASPFLTILGISAGIEFLGKLLSTDSLNDGSNCGHKFEDALSTFTSLRRYSGKNLYHLVRCGLAHRISVQEGIVLSSERNSDLDAHPIVINTNEFYNDFVEAINEAQRKNDWANPFAMQNYVTLLNRTDTGMTANYL
jgi:hypothetical protein